MISGLPPFVAAAVLGSALLHATWNALAKAIPERLLASALMGAAYLIFGAAWCAVAPVPQGASWPFLLSSVVLQSGYLLLLTAAYAQGEFGRVYPVARGTAPLLVTLFSTTVLGEHLHPTQLAGIALVAAALAWLVLVPAPPRGAGRAGKGATNGPATSRADRAGNEGQPDTLAGAPGGTRVPGRNTTGLLLAVATGVVIAIYTVVDGLGVRHAGSAAGYAAWLMMLQGPLLVATCLAMAGPRRMAGWLQGADSTTSTGSRDAVAPPIPADVAAPVSRRRVRPAVTIATGLAGGVLSLAAYAIVLWAQDRASLSLVSATRETSVLFAGVIGAVFFAEGFSARQTVAALSVVAGIVLMQLG